MKKFACVIGFALTFCAAAQADAYRSNFGFSMDLSADWLIMSQQQLQNGVSVLNSDNPRFIGMDSGVLRQVAEKVNNGEMEVYFHKGVGAGGFVNNVNVIRQSARIPADAAELKQTCDQLPSAFSQYFGHPISLYQCALVSVDGKSALLLEFDGALGGTRGIQYQIQKSGDTTLVVTGTFTNGTAEKERTVFAHMVTSMKFQ